MSVRIARSQGSQLPVKEAWLGFSIGYKLPCGLLSHLLLAPQNYHPQYTCVVPTASIPFMQEMTPQSCLIAKMEGLQGIPSLTR